MSLISNLKAERRRLKEIMTDIEVGIPMTNQEGGPRATFISELLTTAANRYPFNPELVKAAMELYHYSDRVASLLLLCVVRTDYKDLIKKAKEPRHV